MDAIFLTRQMRSVLNDTPGVRLYDEKDHVKWVRKLEIKGSWRWDLDEFYLMLHGLTPLQLPEYYYDDEMKVSNGGWLLT